VIQGREAMATGGFGWASEIREVWWRNETELSTKVGGGASLAEGYTKAMGICISGDRDSTARTKA
jgi:hypothetical protein